MKRDKMFAVLPTLLTLGNATCGFGAITIAAKVGPTYADGPGLFNAALLIYLAMVFDMLDGSAARWTRQTSDFGAQLDSLCDALSFGLAPAFLMLQFNHSSGNKSLLPFDYHPRLLWVVAALFVICAVLRLARFTVETEEEDSHDYFSGLPSPAAAGTIASFPIARDGLRDLVASDVDTVSRQLAEWLIPASTTALPVITLALAWLMVSRIRYAHVFNQLFRGQKNRQHLLQLVFTIFLVILVGEMAVPLIFCYFAFSAPVRALWTEILAPRLYKSSGV